MEHLGSVGILPAAFRILRSALFFSCGTSSRAISMFPGGTPENAVTMAALPDPIPSPRARNRNGLLAFIIALRLVTCMPITKESKSSIKKAAARLVRQLPDSAVWDDLMYEILVRQKIEVGLANLHNGRKHTHASIRKEFGPA